MARLPIVLTVWFTLTCFTNANKYNVMPWMCLERCDDDIPANLAEIKAHASVLTATSYEAFDLGVAPDGKTPTLIDNNFTRVGLELTSYGLKTYPMITTVDINKLRVLFSNPEPFVTAVIAGLRDFGATGVNLDFEPCQDVNPTCTAQDAKDYATFLTTFTNGLHSAGFTVSVCVASWSIFWDFDAIAASSVDRMLTMDTYGDWSEFQAGLGKILTVTQHFGGVNKFGVGICTSCGSPQNLTAMFDLMAASGVKEVDVWDVPIPASWYSYF